jgi:hypothetical protein
LSLLKVDMQIAFMIRSGIAANEEGTASARRRAEFLDSEWRERIGCNF